MTDAPERAPISDFTAAMARDLDLRRVFPRAISALQTDLGFDVAALFVLDHERRALYLFAATEPPWDDSLRMVPIGGTASEQALDTGEARIVDTAEGLFSFDGILLAHGVRSHAVQPLIKSGRVIGTLNLGARAHDAFADLSLPFLAALASPLALAVDNALLFERVRASEDRYSSVVENAPQLIYRLDPDGALTFANQTAISALGEPLDALRGRPFAELFPSAEDDGLLRGLATGETDAVALESHRPCDDDTALVTTHRLHALRDGADRLLGYQGFALDVSREHQARRLHEDLVEALDDFVFMADAGGNLLAANRKAREVLGWSAADIASMTIWDLHPPEESAKVEQERWRILESGASTFEIGLRTKSDGDPIPTRARVTYSPESGTLQGVFRDVREERMVQDRLVQVERLRALGEMASGVAHTFNNLLAVIGTTVQVARRMVDDPRVRTELDAIQQAVYDGGASVRRIQDFTRKRPQELQTDIALADLLTEVAQITRHRARERGAAGITVKVESDDPPAVHGSPSELKDVFLNLTFNAIDAISGDGRITIRAGDENGRVVVEIADTGRGMSAETLARVFTPFFSTKGERGSGLGLAIALNVISQHGGSMTIESEPDQGTTVKVLLPPAPTAASHAARPARVLLAESEPLLRAQLERELTGAGHDVTGVATGQEAVDLIADETFDCVFADLAIPEPDALAVVARAKAHGARVVLLAGWGDEVSADAVRQQGIDAVLRKPFPAQTVLNLLE